MLLDAIETYYDTVPRAAATIEEAGPFTIFLAEPGIGWPFYARPRLGADHTFTADDVRRVLARQDELGAPRAIEWVDQVTPSLLPAVVAAGERAGRFPLLALAEGAEVPAPEGTRVLTSDDGDLALVVGVVQAAFDGVDEVVAGSVGVRPRLIGEGHLIEVAAYDDDLPIGGGSAAPRGEVAELMGIGVPPARRKAGTGTAITRALVQACREAGVRTVFLSAYNDAAASIYRRVGFQDVGTACIFGQDDGELRRLGPDDWETFREIRLRALADAPDAFGSTSEREREFTEDDWRQRLTGPLYVVEDAGPVSVGGIFDNAGNPHVWGMWTDPAHRGRGHARRILDALIPPGTPAQLDVNVANGGARAAYERYGFVGTGGVEPLRPGSDQQIELMVLARGGFETGLRPSSTTEHEPPAVVEEVAPPAPAG